jgi:hypothetical protein
MDKTTSKMRRLSSRRAEMQSIRDGVRLRAATFVDRKKKYSREACRSRSSWHTA